jgi:mannose-6-phosphate isomerase-like protein (cupin superfamily)
MIQVTNESTTRHGEYDGFSTHLLMGESNTGCTEISIQTTKVLPGKMQTLHNHIENQCYYIIEGIGTVIIDNEEKTVKSGDAVFIPSNANHGIKNTGETILTYLTANKAFGSEREREIWFA